MMKRVYSVLWLLVLVLPVVSYSAEKSGDIINYRGLVEIYSPVTKQWRNVYKVNTVNAGETIRTGSKSGISIRLVDETLLKLRQNTFFTIKEVQVTAAWKPKLHKTTLRKVTGILNSIYSLTRGSIWMRNNNRVLNSKISLRTVAIGIRGTEIAITANENGAGELAVLEGSALAENAYGELMVNSGQVAYLQQDKKPVLNLLLKPENSVQWTIPFPETLGSELIFKTQSNEFNQAYALMQASEFTQARSILLDGRNINFFSMETQLLLALLHLLTNEYSQAASLLQQDYPESLQSIRSLLQGYLAQLKFELFQAEKYYLKAVQSDSNNEAALYHLAVLYFGMDRNNEASSIINKILIKNPGYTSAKIIQGFILLSNKETFKAQHIFQEIINKHPQFSDAWLGISLVLMRQGKSIKAIESIASAVTLNPQSSLYLSYWGKMLYQLKRYRRSKVVLASAARLDPNDPTPHFYLGLINQQLNQHGQAIKFFQKSIALNDNKAIYRSRSLLDKDLAIRNVDLSQSFNSLGLNQWAAKKAIDAIQDDFTNYSAHLMLSGAYEEDPDRSFLFINEALQSLMFAPATSNSFGSYNHYSSLFEQPELNGLIDINLSNFGQKGIHSIVSSADPLTNLAFNLSFSSQQTDGWRETNNENNTDLTAVIKWQPDDKHNSFLTLSQTRYEKLDDLFPQYEIDAPVDDLADYEAKGFRLGIGYHYHHNYQWDQSVYFLHENRDVNFFNHVSQVVFDNDPGLSTEQDSDLKLDSTSNSLQWQLTFHNDVVHANVGISQLNGNTKSSAHNVTLVQNQGQFIPLSDIQTEYDLNQSFTSIYVGSQWKATNTLTTEFAIYVDTLDNINPRAGGEWTVKGLHPRVGLIYQPDPRHTFRVAEFEYLLPDTSARIDSSTIAGISITRNNQVGSVIKESDIQWEYETDFGLLSVNMFSAKKTLEGSQLINDQQFEYTLEGNFKGAEVILNYLLSDNSGLSASFLSVDIEDETASNYRVDDLMVNTNRNEKLLKLKYNTIIKNNYGFEVEAIHRDMDFKDARTDEQLTILNTKLKYYLKNKSGEIGLKIENLSGDSFNWVTDPLVVEGIAPERKVELSYILTF